MRYLAGDAYFVMEAVEDGFVADHRVREKLQRDLLAEFQVGGAIHFAHAAVSDQLHDSVTVGNHLAGMKAAVIDDAAGLAVAGAPGREGEE